MKPRTSLLAPLQAQWLALGESRRRWAGRALVVVGLALLWWLNLGPAVQTLRTAPLQASALDTQLQTMRGLAARAASLKGQPRIGYDEAMRNLEQSLKQRFEASAQLAVSGERATVTLRNANANALAEWLAQVRANTRAAPVEARLTRASSGGWDGTLVLSLPRR